MYSPGFKVSSRDTPHGKHTVRTARHTRTHTGTRANPNPVFKRDVAHHQVEGGFLVVVVSAKKQGALREAAVVAEGDLTEVVDPHVLADPAVVTDDQFPGVLDGDARFEDHAAPDVRTEKAQEGAFEGARPGEPGLEEQAGDDDPQDTHEPRARIVVRVVELVESRRVHETLPKLLQTVDERLHRHAIGLGLVVADDAVAQDRGGDGLDIFDVRAVLAVERGVDLGCNNEVLRGPRSGAPAQVLVDFGRRAVAAWTGGSGEVHSVVDHVVGHRHAADDLLVGQDFVSADDRLHF